MISDRERLTQLVPRTLLRLAVWSLCLIIIGWAVFYAASFVATLHIVMLPVAIALLLTALLFPVTRRLRLMGLRPIYATWITMLIALAVLGCTGWIIGVRANEEFPRLLDQVQATAKTVENWLYTGPLHVQPNQLSEWVGQLTELINVQRAMITTTVLTGATVALEVLASLVLLLFVTFFLLKDGDRIWSWFLRAFGSATPRVDRAGRAAWVTLSHYVQGTVAVAAVHGVIMGIVLAGMGVPLWAPLAVLIFLASFIPIVGIFFAGAVATLVTLGAQGPIYALVFLGILLVEQQLENHVLQPLIVGRAVNFHPLAIILVLAVGGIIAGIAGAAVAVPIAAVVYRAVPELMRGAPAALPPASSPAASGSAPPGPAQPVPEAAQPAPQAAQPVSGGAQPVPDVTVPAAGPVVAARASAQSPPDPAGGPPAPEPARREPGPPADDGSPQSRG
ncbi:AI-2E family transporter [Planomonospora parontospora]|uniref:AI-2E family transporter n=1 Tax=Planomonospora parontospora TaxID=58119 RepID=UPI0016703606|nr:AI-2E family transporter [Planomonospora parontospora]GGL26732.1 AI-2E family transporter [Planomonospora parontospora subsp. antibiotica]GII16138.1 AI-2E family transporter [Planomonospora parontospora subsp. antibiotica]